MVIFITQIVFIGSSLIHWVCQYEWSRIIVTYQWWLLQRVCWAFFFQIDWRMRQILNFTIGALSTLNKHLARTTKLLLKFMIFLEDPLVIALKNLVFFESNQEDKSDYCHHYPNYWIIQRILFSDVLLLSLSNICESAASSSIRSHATALAREEW